QARKQVLQLRKLNLGLALATRCVLAKDVENHGGAVDDLHFHYVFKCAPLRGRKLGVCDHGICTDSRDQISKLERFSLAKIGCRVWVCATLQHAVEHLSPRGLGESREFTQRVLSV